MSEATMRCIHCYAKVLVVMLTGQRDRLSHAIRLGAGGDWRDYQELQRELKVACFKCEELAERAGVTL